MLASRGRRTSARSTVALLLALALSASILAPMQRDASAVELDDRTIVDSARGEVDLDALFDEPPRSPLVAGGFRDVAGAASAGTGPITGQLLATNGVTTGVPEEAALRIWSWNTTTGSWGPSAFMPLVLAADGTFSLPGGAAGQYRYEARFLFDGAPGKVYWPDSELFVDAETYTLVDGEPFALPPVTAFASWPTFGRIAGSDRYSTSAALSAEVFPDGVRAPVVYLVNGAGFADALSAGPAAASRGGVLLLTRPDSIPEPIQRELERLNPLKIVIVGGTAAISPAVETAVRAYVDNADDVRRLAGSDRYSTSIAVVADALSTQPEGTPIWVATGRSFPDALAAGPAAAHLGGQVLLIDGASIDVSPNALRLIKNQRPWYVVVVGGPGAVTEGALYRIFIELESLGSLPTVMRYGGNDRYETAEVINRWAFEWSGFDVAFVATGGGFADALAGSTAAAALRAPIYLSRPDCLSESTYAEIVSMWGLQGVAIGGTASLSDRVLYGDLC